MTEQLIRALAVNLIYMVVTVLAGVTIWKATDRWLFPNIDFITEIRNGNVAAAILAGVLLLFCGMLVSSGLN